MSSLVVNHPLKPDSRACISVKKCRSLDELPAVLAPLAFERFMRLAERVLVEQEELPK